MKRDVGYAVFAALSLMALTALWALVRAPVLADPKVVERGGAERGSVPRLPRNPDNAAALERATELLATRDLFAATAPAEMASLRRLSVARIAPPVELTPVEEGPRRTETRRAPPPQPQRVFRPATVEPPRPAPVQARPLPAPTPAPAPQAPAPVWTTPPVQAQPGAPPPQPRFQAQPRPQSPAQPPRILQQALTQQRQPVQVVRDGRFPLTLRGVFPDPRTGGRAHVALPNGRVVSTGPGGVIEGFQVKEINAASIIVQGRGSPPLKLEMPGY